jgi:outer membrane lipoprotein LolB
MRKLLCFAFLLATIVLSGCATQTEPLMDHPVYQAKPWSLRKMHLSEKTRWDIQGSVGVSTQGKTQIGSFTWKQIDNRYAINLYGPLNLGSIGIAGLPGKVTLYKPTGVYSATTPEALMQQQLGWYLPISNMYYWIRGLPAPGESGKQVRDNFGHLVLLQQQGWCIQFQAFIPQANADVPRKIIMDNAQVHVKLVITSWNLS